MTHSRNAFHSKNVRDLNVCLILIRRLICFTSILFYRIAIPTSPCTPSPCGSNAICKEQNGVGSCACLPEYIGNPYEGCRPECTVSSDCLSNLACIRNKCQNPCPGTCGQDAICQVINHSPTCTCVPGFTGDPFRYCQFMREPGKVYIIQMKEMLLYFDP